MRNLFLILLSLVWATAGAVRMQPGFVAVRQADGATLTVAGHGDERLCWLTTADGAVVCQVGQCYYIAAIGSDGMPRPTATLAHDPGQRKAAEQALIDRQDRSALAKAAMRQSTRREPMADDATLFPHTGEPRALVVLVEFSDTLFRVGYPYTTFDKYLNGPDRFNTIADPEMYHNFGSVRRYFQDMSFGQFAPKFDIFGPVRLAGTLADYGAGDPQQENINALVADACQAIEGQADFSIYDANGDGTIDLVYIVYAGYSQSITGNSTDCIWPQSGTVSRPITLGGLTVRRYGVNNELGGVASADPKINGIGLFCHEFSHCLGLPDIYPAAGSEAEMCINQGMDYWDLMDAGEYTNNGYCPTEYTAWERERLGWIAIDTLSKPADIDMPTLAAGGKAYRILGPGADYYIVENMQKDGWNKYLLGHGMTATHIDYDDTSFRLGGCRVNSTAGHPRYALQAADSLFLPMTFRGKVITRSGTALQQQTNQPLYDRYLGQTITTAIYKAEAAADTYPGTTGRTTFGADAPLYSGGTLGEVITAIEEDAGTIRFKFMGGTAAGISPLADKASRRADIYTIAGQYAGTDPDRLPHGIYIRAGKKIAR